MVTLSTATAIMLVRKNLDEAGLNESMMYGDGIEINDNLSLDDIIKKNLPEAINAVHQYAPVSLLEGESYQFKTSGSRPEGETISLSSDRVLTFSPSKDSGFLRLVAFQAADSPIVVTDVLKEASPEGRKQTNKYIRGSFDNPKLVRKQGDMTPPVFKYYTVKGAFNNAASAVATFMFVKEQVYSPSATSYKISRLLRQNIIDWLTGMVMETYSDQRANAFFERAKYYAE